MTTHKRLVSFGLIFLLSMVEQVSSYADPVHNPAICRVRIILEYINIFPIHSNYSLTSWDIESEVTVGSQEPIRHTLERYATLPPPTVQQNNYWYPNVIIGTIDVPKAELDRGFTVAANLVNYPAEARGSSRVTGYSGNGCPDEGGMDVWSLVKGGPHGVWPNAWVLLHYRWESTLVSGTDGLVYRPTDTPPGCRLDLMLRGIVINEDTEIGNDEWIIRTQAGIAGQEIEFTTPMFSANQGDEMVRLDHRIGRVELPSRTLPARVAILATVTEDDSISDENGAALLRDLRSRAICAGVRSYIFTVDGWGRDIQPNYAYFKVTLFYELESTPLEEEPISPCESEESLTTEPVCRPGQGSGE